MHFFYVFLFCVLWFHVHPFSKTGTGFWCLQYGAVKSLRFADEASKAAFAYRRLHEDVSIYIYVAGNSFSLDVHVFVFA